MGAYRLLSLPLGLALVAALSGCGGQAVADKADRADGWSPRSFTPSVRQTPEPTFDARRAAALLVKQLAREGDRYQFRYQMSDAPVVRADSVINGVTLADALTKAQYPPLEPTDQVFEGILYMPYYGKTISRNPLKVEPFFDHDQVWVVRRLHIETADSGKMGFTPSPSSSTYFIDLVTFLGPDGTVAAPELPELDPPS